MVTARGTYQVSDQQSVPMYSASSDRMSMRVGTETTARQRRRLRRASLKSVYDLRRGSTQVSHLGRRTRIERGNPANDRLDSRRSVPDQRQADLSGPALPGHEDRRPADERPRGAGDLRRPQPGDARQWAYPDTGKWDPERNVREFLAALPEWRRHGRARLHGQSAGRKSRGLFEGPALGEHRDRSRRQPAAGLHETGSPAFSIAPTNWAWWRSSATSTSGRTSG